MIKEQGEMLKKQLMVCSRSAGEAIKLQHRATKDFNDFLTKAVDKHPMTILFTQMGENYLKAMTTAMAPK